MKKFYQVNRIANSAKMRDVIRAKDALLAQDVVFYASDVIFNSSHKRYIYDNAFDAEMRCLDASDSEVNKGFWIELEMYECNGNKDVSALIGVYFDGIQVA